MLFLANVSTCPSPVVGADVTTKAFRAIVPGSGGRSDRVRRPYASPRGWVGVGRDPSETGRAAGAALQRDDSATPSLTPSAESVDWEFRLSGSAVAESWSWQLQGGPSLRLLQPFRTTRASRRARHIPATAFSVTNGDHVWLESGLEHDLLRKCDRDPDVEWIVSQPFRLSWTEPTFGSHIPDLLTLGASGQVTVWDARRLDEQDDDFRMHAEVASRCCSSVGWCHAVFGELTTIERVNLLWLHGFRRRPSWTDRYADLIWHTACSPGTSLGKLFNLDDGSGELKSVVWHLAWASLLDIDVAASITEDSHVIVNEGLWDV